MCVGHTQSKTLSNTDKDSAEDEEAEVTLGSKGLDKGGDDSDKTSNTHANASSSIIGLFIGWLAIVIG